MRSAGLEAVWHTTLEAPAGADPRSIVAHLARSLARLTRDLALHPCLPVVLGGDHSCALGTWAGIGRARGPLGLVWIDAHMDAHTPQTTPSGMLHGMPLACLLGYGDPRLTAVADGVRLDPRRVCLVGVRSYEAGEAALLARLGVRVFFMDEVTRRGLRPVLAEALSLAGREARAIGLSLDLDAIDPRDAPGVGCPVGAGIRARELLPALSLVARERRLAGVEIAEYNPCLDRRGATARLIGDLLEAMLADHRRARHATAAIQAQQRAA
jgi:arginase